MPILTDGKIKEKKKKKKKINRTSKKKSKKKMKNEREFKHTILDFYLKPVEPNHEEGKRKKIQCYITKCYWLEYKHSQPTSYSCTRRWKLRWQPQAAHMRASSVPSSPSGMNSLHPSTAWPPVRAAWFFWHSPYVTTLILVQAEPHWTLVTGMKCLSIRNLFFMENNLPL